MTDQRPPDKTAALARSFDTASGPLTFAKSVGNDDAYVRETPAGNVLIVIPGMWTSMPEPLLAALRARRRASVTGRCPRCDGVFDTIRGGLLHESDCPATDDLIGPALEEERLSALVAHEAITITADRPEGWEPLGHLCALVGDYCSASAALAALDSDCWVLTSQPEAYEAISSGDLVIPIEG